MEYRILFVEENYKKIQKIKKKLKKFDVYSKPLFIVCVHTWIVLFYSIYGTLRFNFYDIHKNQAYYCQCLGLKMCQKFRKLKCLGSVKNYWLFND